MKKEVCTPEQENPFDKITPAILGAIDAMNRDDSRGEVILMKRVDGHLEVSKVSDVDLPSMTTEQLRQYEVALFDGGNSAGDAWKHVFFPQTGDAMFIPENSQVTFPAPHPAHPFNAMSEQERLQQVIEHSNALRHSIMLLTQCAENPLLHLLAAQIQATVFDNHSLLARISDGLTSK